MSHIRIEQNIENPLLLEIFFGESLWRAIPKKLFLKGLRDVSLALELADYKQRFCEKEAKLAKTVSIEMLSRRSLFASELIIKLQKIGFSQEAIKSAIAYCQELGALSEDKKLKYLVEKALEKGKGELYIRLYLKKYKIDAEKIDRCFEELCIDPRVAIRKLMDKLLKKYSLKEPAQKRKLIHFLQRRGFQLEDILSVISSK